MSRVWIGGAGGRRNMLHLRLCFPGNNHCLHVPKTELYAITLHSQRGNVVHKECIMMRCGQRHKTANAPRELCTLRQAVLAPIKSIIINTAWSIVCIPAAGKANCSSLITVFNYLMRRYCNRNTKLQPAD